MLNAALHQTRMGHFVQQNRFHFGLLQNAQQIEPQPQRTFAAPGAHSFEFHIRSVAHFQHDFIGDGAADLFGTPAYRGKQMRRVGLGNRQGIRLAAFQFQAANQHGQKVCKPLERDDHEA